MHSTFLINFDNFVELAKDYNIEINSTQLGLFKKFFEILLDWNKKINLISRKEENIPQKHFLDSILFLPEIENLIQTKDYRLETRDHVTDHPKSTVYSPLSMVSILDIGSGGGFPAIPLAIMKPEWHFTLCESIKKKVNVLNEIVKQLNIYERVSIINHRVETLHAAPQYKNKYDIVTARAIADLQILIKYSLPLLNKNGFLIAYKSKNIGEEINIAQGIIKKNKLNLKVFSKKIESTERKLVVLSHTSLS